MTAAVAELAVAAVESIRQRDFLGFFAHVGEAYEKRYADPLWSLYPNVARSVSESLALFLHGYAFERQGRPANFPAAAADVISELAREPLDSVKVWEQFCAKIAGIRPRGDAPGLNIMINPLAPKGTPYSRKKNGLSEEASLVTTKRSAVEFVNALDVPLVEWVRSGLENERTDQVFRELCTVTGVDRKIASFFMRDVSCRCRIFPSKDRWLLQPIDIWVRRSVTVLGGKGDDTELANFIVSLCSRDGQEPEKVNQGIWYFCAEIAGSEYTVMQALADVDKAKNLTRLHLESLCEAGTVDI